MKSFVCPIRQQQQCFDTSIEDCHSLFSSNKIFTLHHNYIFSFIEHGATKVDQDLYKYLHSTAHIRCHIGKTRAREC
eukprot:scaffold688_cov105-Cylindrotheca_fusiformis.AAC.3